MVPPHPFQFAPFPGSVMGGAADEQRPTVGSGAAVPNFRPARNSATARFSASVRSWAFRYMLPVVSDVRIDSGAKSARASRFGARFSGLGCAWHVAHVF